MTTHIVNNDMVMCGVKGATPQIVQAAQLAQLPPAVLALTAPQLCQACVIEFNQHPATQHRIAEERAYFEQFEQYKAEPPRKTVEYQNDDPAMQAMDETLDAPPFREPTAAEIQAELPKPKCGCMHAQYAVFVWYNPELQSAGWYTTMTVPLRPVPVVTHCPFCGDELPELIRKNLPEGYPPECYYKAAHE